MKLEAVLTEETINQRLLSVQYAVRGPLLERAEHIERELEKGVVKPFSRVIRANVGDPHALGQRPITFIRQVLALAAWPALLPAAAAAVPRDVEERVRALLTGCSAGSVGAYSPPAGLLAVRQHAAQYLSERDGVRASERDVLLGGGATDLLRSLLALLAGDGGGGGGGQPAGVMIPVPQYPVFSALLAELGLARVDYFLDEARQWAVARQELARAWRAAPPGSVRAIVVINPGNPTGQVLSRENIEEIIQFAYDHRLFIIADEVYQENIISKQFHSFKKVSCEMGEPYASMELASVLTVSKGWAAECGARGALLELRGVRAGVRAALARARAVLQCPPVLGQLALDCVLKPPAEGDPSYPLFRSERRRVHRTLCARAAAACAAFNDIPGYSCNTIEGAMFAFPRFSVPARAQLAAAARGLPPDDYYCRQLLEDTGVCVVPGSGFGQAAGSLHLRCTLLHSRGELDAILGHIRAFHLRFLREYS